MYPKMAGLALSVDPLFAGLRHAGQSDWFAGDAVDGVGFPRGTDLLEF